MGKALSGSFGESSVKAKEIKPSGNNI